MKDRTDKQNNPSWFGKHKVLTVVLVLVVFGIASAASSSGKKGTASNVTTASSASTSTQTATAMPKISQPANDGKFQFTITSMRCGKSSVSSPDGYMTKNAQGQYCLLSVTANNIGDQSQTLDSTSQYLYDSNNKKYSSDSDATIYVNPTDNTFFNQINPGNKVSGTIVFDIPKGVTLVIAELHDSAFSGGVKVNLQ